MGNSVTKFIKPVLAVVASPKTDDMEGFIGAYAKVLNEFDDDALELAADIIVRTQRIKSMPMPADCIDACREAKHTLELRRQRAARRPKPIPEQFMWTEEMAKEADRLFKSTWGRKAVDDGIPVAMWDFMVKHQRWPNQTEYDRVKAESLARQTEMRGYLRIQKENGGIKPMAKSWLKNLKWQSDRLKTLVSDGREV